MTQTNTEEPDLSPQAQAATLSSHWRDLLDRVDEILDVAMPIIAAADPGRIYPKWRNRDEMSQLLRRMLSELAVDPLTRDGDLRAGSECGPFRLYLSYEREGDSWAIFSANVGIRWNIWSDPFSK